MKISNLLIILFLLGFGLFIWYGTANLTSFSFEPMGPTLYPRVLSVIIFVSALYLLLAELRAWHTNCSFQSGPFKSIFNWNKLNWRSIGFLILFFLYCASVITIGYFVSTWIFLFTSMLFITQQRREKFLIIIIISTVIIVVMYFVFDIFKIYLPEALLF